MISLNRSYWIWALVPWIILLSCHQEVIKPSEDFSNDQHSATGLSDLSIKYDTIDESLAFDTAIRADSIRALLSDTLPRGENAYGNLFFGMHPREVADNNAARQKLANYYYQFDYSYNDREELYALYLRSDPEMAIYYETRLQNKYTNLCRIIAEKYGGKNKCGVLPSIFDVMNSKTLYISKWQFENKKIQIGIQQRDLNGYTVICKISNLRMEKQAKKDKYLKDNKKWIDASKKF